MLTNRSNFSFWSSADGAPLQTSASTCAAKLVWGNQVSVKLRESRILSASRKWQDGGEFETLELIHTPLQTPELAKRTWEATRYLPRNDPRRWMGRERSVESFPGGKA